MATKNGKTTYHLTDPRIGGPHNVAVGTYYIPSGGTWIAYVHTHPISSAFSLKDNEIVVDNQVNGYVIGPNYRLLIMEPGDNVGFFVAQIRPTRLTQIEMGSLNYLQISWENHFEGGDCEGYKCGYYDWPGDETRYD